VASAKKEELREPDPFLRATTQMWEAFATHAQKIGIGVAVVIVAVMVFAGLSAHQKGAADEAGAALSKALEIAARPVSKEEPAAGDEPVDPDEKPFKTDSEKQTALIAALQDVRSHFAQSTAGVAALLPLGNAQLRLGKADDASQSYQACVAQSSKDDPLRALAQLGLAHVAESKKDYAAAAAAYDDLMRDAPHSFLKDQAAFGKAAILEAQGQKQQAAEAFAQVKDSYPSTEASREATDRLGALAAAGFKPAPKAAAGVDGGAGMIAPVQLTVPPPAAPPVPAN
jgi:predicted negative regulator of RcsB-dependent stress response